MHQYHPSPEPPNLCCPYLHCHHPMGSWNGRIFVGWRIEYSSIHSHIYAKNQFYLRNLHNGFSSWLFSHNHWLDVSLENTQPMWTLRIISRIISIKQLNTFKSEGLTQRYKSFVHYILNIGGARTDLRIVHKQGMIAQCLFMSLPKEMPVKGICNLYSMVWRQCNQPHKNACCGDVRFTRKPQESNLRTKSLDTDGSRTEDLRKGWS